MIAILKYVVIALLLIPFSFYNLKNHARTEFDSRNTLTLRGLLCLLIVLGHTSSCLAEHNLLDWNIVGRWLNNALFAVSMFFFLSGYGLAASFTKKGTTYLDSFFYKRFSGLLPGLVIISLIYTFVKIFFLGWESERVLAPLYGTFPIESSWYVYSLLVFYVVFYLAFRCISSKVGRNMAVWIGIILYCIVMAEILCWSSHWWITSLAFAVGISYKSAEKQIVHYIDTYPRKSVCVAVLSMVAFAVCSIVHTSLFFTSFIFYWFFPIVIVYIIYGLGGIKSKVLEFCGKISYEIFLIHQLFILVLFSIMPNRLMFVLCVYLCSVAVAYPIHKLTVMIK